LSLHLLLRRALGSYKKSLGFQLIAPLFFKVARFGPS
jgi:hypothetical protein